MADEARLARLRKQLEAVEDRLLLALTDPKAAGFPPDHPGGVRHGEFFRRLEDARDRLKVEIVRTQGGYQIDSAVDT